MEGQRVQEYQIETGPNGMPIAKLGKVHNLITFVEGGKQKVHYLDGRWVDDGGNALDPDSVPDSYKEQVKAIPFKPDRHEASVLLHCEFCDQPIASRDYARHLVDTHIRNGKSATADPETGAGQTVEPTAAVTEEKRRFRPEDLPPDNYVLDDEGFVVLNADGTPRRKAGRPPKAENAIKE